MKKYIYGLFIVLLIIQPLVSKAIVYHNIHHSVNARNEQIISSAIPPSSTLLSENFILDLDDDDEFSETENKTNFNDLILNDQFKICNFTYFDTFIVSHNDTSQNIYQGKSLCILWCVFRI